ncbi:MAG TPA: tyrosine-type recombinase/integrase [Candidatus Acidoferrales bacterium]|nr:tyrosine-type recombinase/integrase [Candidatus Acidoferrales bacterium]
MSADMTMNDLFDRFMQAKENRLAPATLQRYDGLLRLYLRPAFGTKKVAAVKAVDILAAYAQWSKRSISPRTVRHAAELLRNVLRRAVKWEVILRSPGASLDADDLPKVVKPESAVLTEFEVHHLLREARNPTNRCTARHYITASTAFYPAVAFALYTGARLGEIMAMRWGDIDFRQRVITISRSLSDTKRAGSIYKRPKNDRVRTVCVAEPLLAILQSHKAVQAGERIAMGSAYHDEDLIFAKPDGTAIAPWLFSSAFRNFMKRSAVRRIRFHDLRDTHASLLAKAGVPIEVISKRLGHSDISITYDRYITVYRDRDAEAAEAFAKIVA